MAAVIPFIPYIAMAVGAVGALQQANAQAGAMDAGAQAADYNAAVSRQQGEQALQVSSAQQMQQRRNAREVIARQRAAAAQSGTGEGGSNADLLEQSQTLAELDALTIAYEGQLRARGFTTQADLDDFSARALREQSRTTKRAGFFSAGGNVATSAYAFRGSFGSSAARAPAMRSTVGGGSGLRTPSGLNYGSFRYG